MSFLRYMAALLFWVGIWPGDANAGGDAAVPCCFPDRTCVMAETESACWWELLGTPQLGASDCSAITCPPTEACCRRNSFCNNNRPCACDGLPLGPGTDCRFDDCPDRACCLPDGSCQMVDETEHHPCNDLGGIEQEPGLDCATASCEVFEACCWEGGYCDERPPSTCPRPMGAGTSCSGVSCDPVEACCLVDGTCKEIDSPWCMLPPELGGLGGFSSGGYGSRCADTKCPVVEACCESTGCIDVHAGTCPAAGLGPATQCATADCAAVTIFEACCIPGECCRYMNREGHRDLRGNGRSCQGLGGRLYEGLTCGALICPRSRVEFIAAAGCLNGPLDETPPLTCTGRSFANSDLDADWDVDLADVTLLLAHFTE